MLEVKPLQQNQTISGVTTAPQTQKISGVVQANPNSYGPTPSMPTASVSQAKNINQGPGAVSAKLNQTPQPVSALNPIRPSTMPPAINSIYNTLSAGYSADEILIEFVKQNQKSSPKMIENLIKASQAGYDSQSLLDEVLNQNGYKPFGSYQDTVKQMHTTEDKQPGFLTKLGQGIARTPIQVGKAVVGLTDLLGSKLPGTSPERKAMLEQRGTEMIQSPTFGETPNYSVTEGVGKGFELGSYFIGGGGAKNVAQAGFKGLVKEGVKEGAKFGLGAGLAAGFGQGLQEENPTVGSVTGSTLLGGIGGALTGGTLGGLTSAGGAAVRGAINKAIPNLNRQADEAISYGIERGIKPSVVGKKTNVLYNKFLDRSKVAVKYIAETWRDLGLPNLPQNLDEFADAITKAKGNIFARYNFLSEQAGKGQAKVYLQPIVKELRKIADDPVLSDIAPSVAQYADDLATTYAKRGSYGTAEAQRAIELFNAKLKAFYKNPNPEIANKVYVENMIVNNLRKLQDDTIQNATGQNYQALKSIYGALADTEKEVSHRAVVLDRQNVKGLVDMFDVFSGGQVVEGILNGNPVQISRGVVQKVIGKAYKSLNDPNKIVADMFKKVGVLADKANRTGTKLTPTAELKTMLSLPAPSAGTPRGKQPSVNLSPIELGTRSQSTLDRMETANLNKPQLFRKGNPLFRGLGKINKELNDSVPGLYTTSKFNIEYVGKNGKKQVLKNLDRSEASGWAQQLKEQGIKYTVKTAGVAASAYGIGKSMKKANAKNP